jgi:hypothetical protein
LKSANSTSFDKMGKKPKASNVSETREEREAREAKEADYERKVKEIVLTFKATSMTSQA